MISSKQILKGSFFVHLFFSCLSSFFPFFLGPNCTFEEPKRDCANERNTLHLVVLWTQGLFGQTFVYDVMICYVLAFLVCLLELHGGLCTGSACSVSIQ